MALRLAVIDIGTNTILLLVCEVSETGIQSVLVDDLAVARLGQGVDDRRIISQEAFGRAESILDDFTARAKNLNVSRILVTGTSALRDAANSREFVRRVLERFSLPVEILSGEEEALYTFLGATSGMALNEPVSVLDIGGGSTELTTGHGTRITGSLSVDLGSVRLTERFLRRSPPLEADLETCRQYVENVFAGVQGRARGHMLIGVAGTVTTMAAIDLKLERYLREKVSGHILSLETIDEIFDRFRAMKLEQIIQEMRVDPGRADIILAGVLIVREFMRLSGYESITVSDRGLRYGIALREFLSA